MRTLFINMSEDVSIRGYFSKPKGVREEKKRKTLPYMHPCGR